MLGIERLYRLENREAATHFARAAALDSTSTQSTHDQALLWTTVAYLDLGRSAEADSVAELLTTRRERLSDLDRHTLDWVIALGHGDRAAERDAARRIHELTKGSDLSETMHGLAAERLNRPREGVCALAQVDEQGPMGEWPAYWRSFTSAHHMLGDHRRELETARRGRERFPNLFTLVNEVRALAALGRVGELSQRLEQSLAFPKDPAGTTPADVMERAALELRAHGHAEAASAAPDRAIRWYQERPAEERATEARRYGLARALYLAGRGEECETLFGQLAAEKPNDPNYLGYRGVLSAGRGDRREAERLSAALASLRQPDLRGQHTLWRARIASILGQRAQAVALLGEALHQGQQYGAFVHTIPQFAPLRDYPPFQELLRPKG
jgi:tetratricopeptide (TPR) repeat protein